MTDPRRQAYQPYLRLLADRMGLRDWTVAIADGPPAGGDDMASITCTYGRNIAYVQLSDDFLGRSPEENRQTLVHELIHCHCNPAHQIALDAIEADTTKAAFRRLAEHAVDALADALAPHLPLRLITSSKRPRRHART